MLKFRLLFSFISIFFGVTSMAQTISLTYDFESAATFTDFDGGVGTIVANPNPSGINTSANVGQIVRNGGQVWAGTYLTTSANLSFGTDPYICFSYYTTAPVGTPFSFKMDGSADVVGQTAVSGAWDKICFDMTGQCTCNRLVFLFDIGTIGNGSANSTVYIDDIQQLNELVLPFTTNSEYFCDTPGETVTFNIEKVGDWYDDESGGSILSGGSATSTFTTPILTAQEDYWIDTGGVTTVARGVVGPTLKGSSDPVTTASTFFTSNLDNGFWYAVDIVEKIVGGIPPYTCQYTVTGYNLTQGTNRALTWNHVGASDNTQWTYNFPSALPMDLNDNMELRVSVAGDVGCYVSSHHAGGDVITSYPSTTSGGELTFTSHTPSATQWTGFDFDVSGDLPSARVNVNAIVNCDAIDCLTPLNDTLCLTPPASASLGIVDAGGTYNWYDVSTGGSILSGGSNTATYTTPVIGAATSYWVEEVGGTSSSTYVTGPTVNGSTDPLTVARVQFTSLISGTLNSVTMYRKMVGANNGNPCQYRILLWDWTEYNTPTAGAGVGIVDYFAMVTASTSDNVPHTITFPTGTLIAGHNYEFRIEANITMAGGAGGNTACYTSAHFSGDGPNAVATSYPGLDFMNHGTWDGTPPGPDDGKWTGYDWNVTEDGTAGPCTGAGRTEVLVVEGDCILETKFISLNANNSTRGVLLEWKTNQNEVNYFKVTRSTDGVNFETIDIVKGISNELNYTYTAVDFKNDNAYYQVIQIDKENKEKSSNIEKLVVNSINEFSIYPNPTSNSFFIFSDFDSSQNLEILVFDVIGKNVVSYQLCAEKGAFKKEMDFSAYSSGVYTIQIKSENDLNTIKLIKD